MTVSGKFALDSEMTVSGKFALDSEMTVCGKFALDSEMTVTASTRDTATVATRVTTCARVHASTAFAHIQEATQTSC